MPLYVIGHRGAAGLIPENTMESFLYAIDLGVHMVECDVRLTQDGHLVLMHDQTVDRTTNGSGNINDMTFDEVQRLDAGGGRRVPLLAELLDVLGERRISAEVEIKEEQALRPALRLIREKQLTDFMCITAKLPVLEEARRLEPDIALGVPSANPSLDDIKKAASLQAASVGIHYKHIREETVAACHEFKLDARGWNPLTEETTRILISHGVDGITTDRPDIALKLITQSDTTSA